MGLPKGVSGNPNGRTKGTRNKSTEEVKTLLEANVSFPEVVKRLYELTQGVEVRKETEQGAKIYKEKPDAYAARVLLEYRFGKPVQQVVAEVNGEISEIRRTVLSKKV